jgi:hypothetical protein
MPLTTFFAAAIFLAATPTVPRRPDPFAPARAGQLACHSPSAAPRTCRTLARYTWARDGRIEVSSDVLMSKDTELVFRSTTIVEARAGAFCGRLRPEDVDRGTILWDGRPLPPHLEKRTRSEIYLRMSQLFGREVCTAYVRDGSGLKTRVTVDGKEQPRMTEPMIWIRSPAGYTVGLRRRS